MASGGARIRLLVFDWDGTLEDSASPIVTTIEQTLTLIGKTPPPRPEIRNVIGLNLVEGLAMLYPQDDARRLAQQCRAVSTLQPPSASQTGTPEPAQVELFAGVRSVLSDLARAGLWLAVATGKSRRGLDSALQRHALADQFLATRTADDARSKPHPEMLLSILDELGVLPSEALMVGDTSYDLNMANAAGMDCVGVTYGVHSVATLQATGHAKAYIDHLSALPRIVDTLS